MAAEGPQRRTPPHATVEGDFSGRASVARAGGDGRPEAARAGGDRDDPLLECLSVITRLHGRAASPEALAAGLPLHEGRMTPTLFVRAAARRDLSARVVRRRLGRISNLLLPAVLLLEDGGACVLTRIASRGEAEVIFPETGFGAGKVPLKELRKAYGGYCIFVRPAARPDDRVDELRSDPRRFWLWRTLWRFRRYYAEALLATAMINVLALATALFIMNVYDRVVPNNAVETLVVLATGTLIAVGFEFLARSMRGYFLEVSARKADLLLAGTLFHQALGLTMEARPPSAGAFASQLREFESLRDFLASATLTALSDLPFIFFFIWVISLIGGPLYKVPLLAVPLVVLVGMLAQIPLAIVMRRHMRESNLRHGLLVESVEGMETLKTLNAEGRMQGRWEDYTALTGRSAASGRMISAFVVNFAQITLQCMTVLVVVWGVFLIGEGELTVGGLIACVIIGSRGLAPLSQVASLLTRYQHARAAYLVLDELMRRPVERPPERVFMHHPSVSGDVELAGVDFAYPGSHEPVLQGMDLRIRAGEHVAILGRVGSGKTTLLKLVLGLYHPTSGSVLLDGADVRQYDPADLRRNVAYVSQDVRLFYGTLRENVAMGAPLADDAAVLEAARVAGLDALVGRDAAGFERMVPERGDGLSGGQKQAIAIARAILKSAPVLLLDEPTSAMDHATEQAFLARFREYARGRTVVLVTHKPSLVGLADRVVVIERGKVVADGPRDEVLKALVTPIQTPGRGPGGPTPGSTGAQ